MRHQRGNRKRENIEKAFYDLSRTDKNIFLQLQEDLSATVS